MSLKPAMTTPWVRAVLRNDPDQAMAIESIRRTAPFDGSLLLIGNSARGPWQATIHGPGSPSSGWRGNGTTLLIAVEKALREAQA